ncbi:MAG: hypothetical protein WA941_06120 [Nitrososphaeraceae archaeon]
MKKSTCDLARKVSQESSLLPSLRPPELRSTVLEKKWKCAADARMDY